MSDREQLAESYSLMYQGMIEKDITLLDRLLDVSFTLFHMTGMRQSKAEYLAAIADGTLNYYAEETERFTAVVNDDTAQVTGQSKVSAAVFGGRRHIWRLQLDMKAVKGPEGWRFIETKASTW